MRHLRFAFARCLMVMLMAMFVMGSFGMGAAGAATAVEPTHITDHAARPGSDCRTMDETGAPMQNGHAACMMTVCCFSEASQFVAMQPKAQLHQTSYALLGEALLTQSEPERAKKPPKHA